MSSAVHFKGQWLNVSGEEWHYLSMCLASAYWDLSCPPSMAIKRLRPIQTDCWKAKAHFLLIKIKRKRKKKETEREAKYIVHKRECYCLLSADKTTFKNYNIWNSNDHMKCLFL